MGACLLFLAAVFSTMGVEAPAFVLELLFFTIRTEHTDEWGVLSGALESLGPQTETVSVHGWAEKLRRAAQVRGNFPFFANNYPLTCAAQALTCASQGVIFRCFMKNTPPVMHL